MDDMTHRQIRALLNDGLFLLPPVQQAIVTDCYLREPKVTQKSFLREHLMKKERLESERHAAISSLRRWLKSHQIRGMRDID
jgi:hypothetical protein